MAQISPQELYRRLNTTVGEACYLYGTQRKSMEGGPLISVLTDRPLVVGNSELTARAS